MFSRFNAASVTCRMCSGRLSSFVASAVRVDSESKFGDNHQAIAKRRKRFSHQFFVCERTISLGSVKEGNAAIHCSTYDVDTLLLHRGRAVVGAQPHAAEAQGGHLQTTIPECAFLHGFSRILCFQAKEKRVGTGIPILPNRCPILPNRISTVARVPQFVIILSRIRRDSDLGKHPQSIGRSGGPKA